jgi:hypothetical protein
MLAWLLIATAWAGTVQIEVKVEDHESGHVFVDGKHRGEVRPGKKVSVDVSTGRHELAVAYDADAHWLICIGDLDARKDTEVEVMGGNCTAITKAEPRDEKTVREGSFVSFTGAGADGTVEIAGRRHAVKPGKSLIANVPDGTYDVKAPSCEGKVTVKDGQTRAIAIADGKCIGLDGAAKKKKKK